MSSEPAEQDEEIQVDADWNLPEIEEPPVEDLSDVDFDLDDEEISAPAPHRVSIDDEVRFYSEEEEEEDDGEAEAEAEPEAESRPQPKPKPRRRPKPEPQPEPQPEPTADAEPAKEDGFDSGIFGAAPAKAAPAKAAPAKEAPAPEEAMEEKAPEPAEPTEEAPDAEPEETAGEPEEETPPAAAVHEQPAEQPAEEPEEEPADETPDDEEESPEFADSPRIPSRWIEETWNALVEERPERKATFATSWGEALSPLYTTEDRDFARRVGLPGQFPYTRGVHPTMYRGRLWTMRQYAGFATAKATNERFKYLLEQGQTGLSVAFDLPTQIGYDSDDPRAAGEVGKVGVPINSLKDMEVLLDGIPLDEVSLSMTINSTAIVLLLMVVAVAKKQGVSEEKLRGTIQNDMLKEFVARNTDRFPLDSHLKLTTDLFRYCSQRLPLWNTISVSGYHMREAGCTSVQEVAFTLANGIAYVEKAIAAGLDVDSFAGRISFFFGAHNNLIEEVAKFRAARRMWAKIMKSRFGASNPKSQMLRFHTQTCGSTLTATQPITNVVRVAMQALAAALGGTQSLHTNSWDEALGLPTQESALLALRTQQVIANESGIADVVDPLGGTPLVEELTDRIEAEANAYLEKIDELGGAVEAIRSGWMKGEIEAAAYAAQKAIEAGEQVVVGVNEYVMDDQPEPDILSVDEEQARQVVAGLASLRESRDEQRAAAALAALEISAAWGDADIPDLVLECVQSYCTIGEICRTLETVLAGPEA